MKAIETRYLGPTDYRGARIKADDGDGNTLTIPYPHEGRDGEEKHAKAAYALRNKMEWTGNLVGGATKRGYVFVFFPQCRECGNEASLSGNGLCVPCVGKWIKARP